MHAPRTPPPLSRALFAPMTAARETCASQITASTRQVMTTTALKISGNPGTLYARCGGVFGISAFVDRCMDLWMADNVLNDNKLVARWHANAQPGSSSSSCRSSPSPAGRSSTPAARWTAAASQHLRARVGRFMEIFNEGANLRPALGGRRRPERADDLDDGRVRRLPGDAHAATPARCAPAGTPLLARLGVYPSRSS